MKFFPVMALTSALFVVVGSSHAEEMVFQDDFKGKLDAGWSWLREDRSGWRVTQRGLEVRIQPGNMWGPGNDAKNVLVRTAPDRAQGELEVSVSVTNQPTAQYEQVDLVWYYDDRHMVKLGQELVDGQLSIVMGREEADQTRTIAIIPAEILYRPTTVSGSRRPHPWSVPDARFRRLAGGRKM